MSDNPVLSEKDRALFRRAIAGVVAAKSSGAQAGGRVTVPVASLVLASASNQASSPDDRALFHKAMQGVKPLAVDRQPSRRPQPRPVPLRLDDSIAEGSRSDASVGDYGAASDSLDEVPEVLWFHRPGLQHLLLRKLRRGRLPVGAELDLHGMIVAEARLAVDRFLVEAGEFGIRCVRIIHGKGKLSAERRPVLKGLLNRWLRDRDEVLAFSSARPEDGGTGAVHVLLRRGGR